MQVELKISHAPPYPALPALNGYPPLAVPTSSLQVVNPDLAFIEVTALGRDQKLVEDDDVAQMWPFWSLSSSQEANFVIPSHMAPETVILVAVPGLLQPSWASDASHFCLPLRDALCDQPNLRS